MHNRRTCYGKRKHDSFIAAAAGKIGRLLLETIWHFPPIIHLSCHVSTRLNLLRRLNSLYYMAWMLASSSTATIQHWSSTSLAFLYLTAHHSKKIPWLWNLEFWLSSLYHNIHLLHHWHSFTWLPITERKCKYHDFGTWNFDYRHLNKTLIYCTSVAFFYLTAHHSKKMQISWLSNMEFWLSSLYHNIYLLHHWHSFTWLPITARKCKYHDFGTWNFDYRHLNKTLIYCTSVAFLYLTAHHSKKMQISWICNMKFRLLSLFLWY